MCGKVTNKQDKYQIYLEISERECFRMEVKGCNKNGRTDKFQRYYLHERGLPLSSKSGQVFRLASLVCMAS